MDRRCGAQKTRRARIDRVTLVMHRASRPEALFLAELASPIGAMLVVSDKNDRLRALDWIDYEARLKKSLRLFCGRDGVDFTLTPKRASPTILKALVDYFNGDLRAIDRLEVCTNGTPFQRAVWTALRALPVGQTQNYGAFAAGLKRPTAVRAVGHANGANPISVVVPCHRLIGASGALTGYAGGLARKRWLLRHEGVVIA